MNCLSPEKIVSKAKEWAHMLGLDDERSFTLQSPALLVLDMQNEFLLGSGQLQAWGGPAIISNVTKLIAAFRDAGALVIFSRHICLEPRKHQGQLAIMERVSNAPDLLRDGSKGAEFHGAVRPSGGDLVITKYRYSAFYDTPLDTVLRINQVSDVIITGVATNICCEATAHDAFFRGYGVAFAIDATGGTDEAAHLATLKNIQLSYGRLVTTDQLTRSLPTK